MKRPGLPAAAALFVGLGLPTSPASAYELDQIPVTRWPERFDPRPITPAEHAARVPLQGDLVLEELQRRLPADLTRAEAQRGRVLVLVDAGLEEPLAAALAVFVDDLALDGHSVLLETSSGGTAEQLKAHLAELYAEGEGLEGAILVGELPMAWFEFFDDYQTYGYAVFPADLALMDLDGDWTDSDGNGIADVHSDGQGDTAPEIWLGRLVVPYALGDEAEVLTDYFARNHAFRRGEILPTGSSLVYVDDDWAWWAPEYAAEIERGFPEITQESELNTTSKADYLPRLGQDFDNIAVFVHSSPEQHYFVLNGDYDVMDWPEVPSDATALFYDLFACSNANFAEPMNMGAVYALGTEYGLLALGSTKTGSMLERSHYYRRLGSYAELGEAFRGWFEDVQPYDTGQRDYWYYGMAQIGDPSLRVGYPIVTASVDEILIDAPEAEPVEVSITLGNAGLDGYYWSLGLAEGLLADQDWIQPSDVEGQVLVGADTFIIHLDPELARGADPSQTLLVHAPGASNNPLEIPLEILRWGAGELCVDPSPLDLALESPEERLASSLQVGNCNPGPLEWTVSSDAHWLELERAAGGGEDGVDTLNFTIDGEGLLPGERYEAMLVFESPAADNSPLELPVWLEMDPAVGPPACGCATRGEPRSLAWLGALLLGGVGLVRRRS